MKYTPDNITQLADNQRFVYGSNKSGRHGAGAARLAYEKFGAEWGVGEGLTGQCYALPTKDENIETMSLGDIQKCVKTFMKCAKDNPSLEFLVTKVGCGLAGYEVSDIAPLFFTVDMPKNVVLPKEFWNYRPKSTK